MNKTINIFTLRVNAFSWVDVVIVLFLLVGTLIAIPLMQSQKPGVVLVYKDNKLISEYPLETDRKFAINGANGPMKLDIHSGTVSIKESDCPKHVCMKAGDIRYPYQQLVCAPNHVLVVIRLPEKSQFDAIAQ